MFAAAGIIIIITLCVAHFYLKSSALASFAAVISVVLAFIVSFGYYEVAADILISRGKGGQWAQPTAFLFIFILGTSPYTIRCPGPVSEHIPRQTNAHQAQRSRRVIDSGEKGDSVILCSYHISG